MLATYEWKLQLLSRIGVFHNELAECLAHTVLPTIFSDFVEMIIRKIEFIARLASVSSETFSRTNSFNWSNLRENKNGTVRFNIYLAFLLVFCRLRD